MVSLISSLSSNVLWCFLDGTPCLMAMMMQFPSSSVTWEYLGLQLFLTISCAFSILHVRLHFFIHRFYILWFFVALLLCFIFTSLSLCQNTLRVSRSAVAPVFAILLLRTLSQLLLLDMPFVVLFAENNFISSHPSIFAQLGLPLLIISYQNIAKCRTIVLLQQ